MIKIHKALPVLVLLAIFAGGFSGVQAGYPQQDVTPTASETPAVAETAAPTEGQSAPVDENATTAEWPQVQNNPARTGFYSGSLGTNFTIGWRRAFQPEKIYPQVQAIVAGGKVLVGTEMGNLYALDALTGAQAWPGDADVAALYCGPEAAAELAASPPAARADAFARAWSALEARLKACRRGLEEYSPQRERHLSAARVTCQIRHDGLWAAAALCGGASGAGQAA